ncbi:FHA domain-containing protein [Singulisphaera rosea]
MRPTSNVLGILKPMGGGDPIPLVKSELIVGRRPSCDICLDFNNISGKHCMLRLLNNVWHIRDLGSTNGTTFNGAAISSEHSVMPDDEIGIAGRLFTIDYEPAGPESIMRKHDDLDEELADTRKRHSLMELAGLETDDYKPTRPSRAPEHIDRMSTDEGEFDSPIADDFNDSPPPAIQTNDDDFFKLIEEDFKR